MIIKQIILVLAMVFNLSFPTLLAWPGISNMNDIRIIGYSEDGNFFAYETFGTNNNGTPYAAIYVLDLANNKLVDGTPINSSFSDGDYGNVLKALLEVRPKATPILTKLNIRYPYRELASVTTYQKVANPNKVSFARYRNTSSIWTIHLSEILLNDELKHCKHWENRLGFTLSVAIDDGILKEIYKYNEIPTYPGCPPTDYKLAKVVEFNDERTIASRDAINTTTVVLINIYRDYLDDTGVEFLAIPVKLPLWRDYYEKN